MSDGMSYRPAQRTWNQPLYTPVRRAIPVPRVSVIARKEKTRMREGALACARQEERKREFVRYLVMRAYRCITRPTGQSDNRRRSTVALHHAAGAHACSLDRARRMASPLRDLSRGRSWGRSRFRASRYRAKISFAVGGFMGLADLRPLPIPLHVRYKLIDSCSLAGAVPAWYAAATIAVRACERSKNTKKKKERREEEKKRRKKRSKSKWRRRERRYIALHSGTKLNLCPAGRGTYSSFEPAMRLQLTRSQRTNWSIKTRPSYQCIQRSAISSCGILICPETYVRVKIDDEYCNQRRQFLFYRLKWLIILDRS